MAGLTPLAATSCGVAAQRADFANAKSGLSRAKRYSSIKYSLAIIETVFLLACLLLFLGLGGSKVLAARLSFALKDSALSDYLAAPLYLLIISLIYYFLSLPFNLYQSYILEHKFSLSKEKFPNWFFDQLKSGLLSYIIGLILVSVFYYILRSFLDNWWLIISLFWILFSLVLARLVPVFIIPLFFKYKKLSDEPLKKRIMDLADKMKVKVLDCFEIDFSKKTLKANAAFAGWGAAKRVILADTLKDKYTLDEIEVILAHEFAHYKLRHLVKLILANSLMIMLCFYLIFKTSGYTLGLFGLSSLSDIAALPLIFIYFVLFGIITRPLENYISRRFEKDADMTALSVTGLTDAFISMMDKLAGQNLADRIPHPVIKFFFFDHPPVEERIAMARRT